MADTVKAESDDRTVNNAVRHGYRVLSPEEKQHMLEVKDLGALFIDKCKKMGSNRELSIAITKVEEAVMWAVKAITA